MNGGLKEPKSYKGGKFLSRVSKTNVDNVDETCDSEMTTT
jgi:hypothetical protein